MKIAIIFPNDSDALFDRNSKRTFGGANVQMYLIAKEFGNYRDIQTYSFIPEYKNISFDDEDCFNLVKTYNENESLLKKFLIYHKTIRKIKPDVIIQRGLTLFSCLLAFYCKIFKIKFIFMLAHDIESHGRYQKDRKKCFLFPLLLQSSFLMIAQNEYEFDNLIKKIPIGRVEILKKGIDISKIHKKKRILKYHAVWIARCEAWKKPELFIKLAQKNKDLNFFMVCSISFPGDPYFYRVKELALKQKNLKFEDFLKNKEIYNILSQSGVFCITSDMEGDWPMVVLEASASGIPILSLNLNYGDLFSKYNGGFFCNGHFTLMSQYLREVYNNKELYSIKSEGAASYIKENHNIKTNVKKLYGFINSR